MIIGFILTAVLIIWSISVRCRLVGMDENIDHAMRQMGVQLASCFDALAALLHLTKEYSAHESQVLIETIKSRRNAITAASTPDDIQKQEQVISEILEHVSLIVKQYPTLKDDENYGKRMNAVNNYEKMVHTSRLIYNDNVTRFNRELRMFPGSLIAGIFGFHEREYLEAVEESIF